MNNRSVGIIGGGVSGLCCAFYLQRQGFRVTVIDKDGFTEGCSYLNAGMVVPSHFIPLASPGAARRGLEWMWRSGSPFTIHPRADPELLRWIWLFHRACSAENMHRGMPLLRDINRLSLSLYRQMTEEGMSFGWRERGLLMMYRTRKAEREEAARARLAAKAGVEAEVLSPEQLRRLEPGVETGARGAVYFPGDAHLSPRCFMEAMKDRLGPSGVAFLAEAVTGFSAANGKITEVVTPNRTVAFDEVVLAAGAASALLARKLSFRLPLQGGRGYSFDVERSVPRLRIPALLVEGKVAVTPIGAGLRVAGTMELGSQQGIVPRTRVAAVGRTFSAFYPGYTPAVPAKVSAGLRPCSPDGLPYIGRVRGWDNLTIATGHGMMGMSLGPATGRIVSDILSGRKPPMDCTAFSPDRFGR
jgi:D-amino-acid dehydrogenase